MRRLLIVTVATVALSFLAGCVTMQELGGDAPPREDAGPQGLVIDAAPASTAAPAPTNAAPWASCPTGTPIDRGACDVDVGWCDYPFAPERGLVSKCSCGADKRWTCLRVHVRVFATRSAHEEELAFTNGACTEGARCDEGVRCTIAKQRTCSCTSSRRFMCSRPAE